MRQFMVRVIRSTDDDYADVVVDADTEKEAEANALAVVEAYPNSYFDEPEPPKYYVDLRSDVEDVTGGEYDSDTRVGTKHV